LRPPVMICAGMFMGGVPMTRPFLPTAFVGDDITAAYTMGHDGAVHIARAASGGIDPVNLCGHGVAHGLGAGAAEPKASAVCDDCLDDYALAFGPDGPLSGANRFASGSTKEERKAARDAER